MGRIGLSGIYIFDTFEGEDKRQPTCIEDCREETREEWLKSLNRMALDNTLSIIFESYKKLAQMLTDDEMVYLVDVMCRQLHGDAKYYGIMPQKE
jgi:hypothetical protein